MANEAFVPYQKINRYEKTFEVIQGQENVMLAALHRITKAEAERVFGANGIVPEGTAVKIATPGTVGGVTYVEGDLMICDANDVDLFGFTYQKVIPVDTQFPYKRKPGQTAVFYDELVAVASGHSYLAVFRSNFVASNPSAKDSLYIGDKGVVSKEGENGVVSPPTGLEIGYIVLLDELPVRHSDGQPDPSAVHKEITVYIK